MTNRNQQMFSSIMDETKETIRVMLVDDHQIVIDGLKSLLAEIKNIAIVAEANNGKDAIEILSKTAADIVLIDIEMPIMNGWDATKIITSRYPQTKVIALTTFSEKAIIKKMLNAGASGYILKNIKKDILLEAIIAVHNGEKYFSSEISLLLLKPSAEEIIVPKKQNSSVNLLTTREVEILKLIAGGLSNAETAEKLFISPKTVKAHRENIMKKLDLHNVVDLVRCAIDSGFID
ncbi:MAG: response regulator transcription factor [Bacteroidota bacterium]